MATLANRITKRGCARYVGFVYNPLTEIIGYTSAYTSIADCKSALKYRLRGLPLAAYAAIDTFRCGQCSIRYYDVVGGNIVPIDKEVFLDKFRAQHV